MAALIRKSRATSFTLNTTQLVCDIRNWIYNIRALVFGKLRLKYPQSLIYNLIDNSLTDPARRVMWVPLCCRLIFCRRFQAANIRTDRDGVTLLSVIELCYTNVAIEIFESKCFIFCFIINNLTSLSFFRPHNHCRAGHADSDNSR